MKQDKKYLLIPDAEYHRLESQYGYTSKTELTGDAKDKMSEDIDTTSAPQGSGPYFHVLATDVELQDRITPKVSGKQKVTKVGDESRERATMH